MLEFEVSNQILKRTDSNKAVNLSQEYLECSFDFKTEDWDNLSVFALFTNSDRLNYRVALSEDKCIVPNACLIGNYFYVSVYGVDTEDLRITSSIVKVYLLDSNYTSKISDDLPDEQSVVEEIYAAINGKADLEHTHTKSDITDFPEVYTKTEVDTIVQNTIDSISNRISLDGDKTIIQTGDTVTFTSYLMVDGVPQGNKTIEFYKED